MIVEAIPHVSKLGINFFNVRKEVTNNETKKLNFCRGGLVIFSVLPNRPAFTAISADINIFSADGNILAELFIALIMPYLFKRLTLQIT